ncbi:hypothetical protein RV134_80003 [Roseovarius sp. EC-HK134]|nr:hypothetical protein RV134_80003 [Roseovarius sp. EC-HK134]
MACEPGRHGGGDIIRPAWLSSGRDRLEKSALDAKAENGWIIYTELPVFIGLSPCS